MTDKELEFLLSRKAQPVARENLSLVLSAQTARTAARLRKRRADRRQLMLCLAAALVFVAAAAGLMVMLKHAESPETILRPAVYAVLGGMGLTLILAPAIAWFSDEDRKNEA